MKKFLTNNIGLKILSVLGAILLWIIVINIDDPVISRVYAGIPVEIVNSSAITDEGKTFEVENGSDVISVVISAERSVIEELTKENIKATADMRNITFMNNVPIEVRTNRFSDKINSISAKEANLSVIIEDRKEKQLKLSVITEGEVAQGYISGAIKPVVDVIKVTGPESKVNRISVAEIMVDLTDMNESYTTSCPIILRSPDGQYVDEPSVNVSMSEVRTDVEILETKEIPVTAGFTGSAAPGFSPTGTVICEPSSIVVAGKGSTFNNLSSVKIPDETLSIDGAIDDVAVQVNVKELLPNGVILAGKGFDGLVNLVAVVEQHAVVTINLPVDSISVVNLPKDYSAQIISDEDTIPVEISGLPEPLEAFLQSHITAHIDAAALVSKTDDAEDEDEVSIHVGTNEGKALIILPEGLTQLTDVTLKVIVTRTESE